MPERTYELGRRRASVERHRAAILAAARDRLAAGTGDLSVGAVAAGAGVSRLTIYNQFGSKAGLIAAVSAQARDRAPAPKLEGDARFAVEARLSAGCRLWVSDPALFRRLPQPDSGRTENRELATFLAASDALRPGCSIKEAEDVIGVLTSFETFDRLHQDGRRPLAQVVLILMRIAEGILA
jgi:AcrR family transcriptional regulator